MKNVTLIMFLFISMLGFGQTWTQLPYYFPPTPQSTPKIFTSPNDLLVAGISYNSAPASHISLDGGTTWQQIFADKPIASAEFGPDGTIYFIATKRYLTTSNYYTDTLFTSTDGINWTNMGYKLKDGYNEYDFTISGNNTLLFPNLSNIDGKFFSKSTNNGVAWTNTAVEANQVTCNPSADTIIISFTSPWPGGIKYSHDGGVTVNTATGIAAGGTIPIWLPNGDIYAASVGQIYKSTNAGVTFTQVPLNSSVVQIQEFLYGTNGKFYIRVLNGIWETTDFTNVTAITSTLPDYNLIKDMDISDNYIYAITDTNLYRLPLSSGTSISESRREETFEIFPNPAKEQISISSSFNGNTQFEIYDLQGKRVLNTTILLEENEPSNMVLPKTLHGLYIIRMTNKKGETQHHKISIE